jgi:predicted transcriptional regulator
MPKIAKAKARPDSEDAEFLAAVEEGIADADAGRMIPYEKVRRWLLSWGTDKELPPPRCR